MATPRISHESLPPRLASITPLAKAKFGATRVTENRRAYAVMDSYARGLASRRVI